MRDEGFVNAFSMFGRTILTKDETDNASELSAYIMWNVLIWVGDPRVRFRSILLHVRTVR